VLLFRQTVQRRKKHVGQGVRRRGLRHRRLHEAAARPCRDPYTGDLFSALGQEPGEHEFGVTAELGDLEQSGERAEFTDLALR
jgi:hypothetical protein